MAGAVVGSVLTYFITREPNAMSDPQGGSSFFCDVREIASVESSLGMTLTARNTTCTILGTSSVTYVFLTLKGQAPSRVNLILRCDGEDPYLKWTSDRQASIRVTNAFDVDKQVTKLFGVDLIYTFN